ncbi:MAG: hypothetical protein ABWW65_05275 [Thermoprotei archaeon]
MSYTEHVLRLKRTLSYVRSIDGFLVKIGGFVYELEDMCRDGGCDPRLILEEVLSSSELYDSLARFSCYRSEIINAITSDPRHKILRKYLDVIHKVLSNIECRGEEQVVVTTPEATWVKEKREEVIIPVSRQQTRHKIPVGLRDPWDIVKILLIISIVSFIVVLILIITS